MWECLQGMTTSPLLTEEHKRQLHQMMDHCKAQVECEEDDDILPPTASSLPPPIISAQPPSMAEDLSVPDSSEASSESGSSDGASPPQKRSRVESVPIDPDVLADTPKWADVRHVALDRLMAKRKQKAEHKVQNESEGQIVAGPSTPAIGPSLTTIKIKLNPTPVDVSDPNFPPSKNRTAPPPTSTVHRFPKVVVENPPPTRKFLILAGVDHSHSCS